MVEVQLIGNKLGNIYLKYQANAAVPVAKGTAALIIVFRLFQGAFRRGPTPVVVRLLSALKADNKRTSSGHQADNKRTTTSAGMAKKGR
jgi:hypothetical protein